MPTINGAGHYIQDIAPQDAKRWQWLAAHKWPEDCDRLWHMNWFDFCNWLYQMNPRDAMLLSNDKDFSRFRVAKQQKGMLSLFVSWIWRKLWA